MPYSLPERLKPPNRESGTVRTVFRAKWVPVEPVLTARREAAGIFLG
jgi:hypothetical protein